MCSTIVSKSISYQPRIIFVRLSQDKRYFAKNSVQVHTYGARKTAMHDLRFSHSIGPNYSSQEGTRSAYSRLQLLQGKTIHPLTRGSKD